MWILVITVITTKAAAISSFEMSSLTSCEAAAEQIVEDYRQSFLRGAISTVCVEK